MPKMLHHVMASKIQQRFWYAHGRWNTAKRIGKRLLEAGLDLRKPAQLLFLLGSTPMPLDFPIWFRRLLPKHVAMSYCMRSVLNAFGICAFKYQCVDRAHAGADRLIELASDVAQALDAKLRSPSAFEPILLEQLEQYLAAYREWFAANEVNVREALHQALVSFALQNISRRTERAAMSESERACKLSFLVGGSATTTQFMRSSREVQLIKSLPNSKFWGPGDTSIFRLMHEALMDERYVLPRETVCAKFRAHYIHIPLSKTRKFLRDLEAVLLFTLQDPIVTIDMVRALGVDDVEDYAAFADRLIPLIARAVHMPAQQPLAQQILASWQECDRGSPESVLGVLREAAISLRYAFALEELDQCQRNVRRGQGGLYHTRADIRISELTTTKRTEAWIARILQHGPHPHLERLAAGDPFALLRFHDHEIMRFVLEGHFDAPLLVPEVLQFDLGRMRGIVCDGCAPERIIEMVDTMEVPDSLPQYLKESVASLRKIVFVCRFQHGQRIADITQSAALRLLQQTPMVD